MDDTPDNSVRVVILLSQCSGGDSLRIAPIIAFAFLRVHRRPCPYLIVGKNISQ